jgi:cytochrome c
MKSILAMPAFGIVLLFPTAALADSGSDVRQLAEEKQCLSCHERKDDTPRAPGFTSIAAKYSGGEMRSYLIDVVLAGGEAHWGSAVMPAPEQRVEVSQEEAERLVDWILEMHPGQS